MGNRRFNRIGILLLGAALLALLGAGCVRQDAWLTYTVPETEQPTATAEVTPPPTREPIPLEVEPIVGESFLTDRKGIPILDGDTHYFTYYLTFLDLRVYEEEGYTYLDGVCNNSFEGTLSGGARICFYDGEDRLVGYGVLHTADGSMNLIPGANRIYAEILSEVDVQQLALRIEQVKPFKPV